MAQESQREHDVLSDLLLRWEELHEQGQEVSPEELCRDCPEQAAGLSRRIHALKAIGWVNRLDQPLGEGGSGEVPPMPLPGNTDRQSYVLEPGKEPAPGYRLMERLGTGGFGEVWKAETPGGFRVALKFVRLDDKAGSIEIRTLEILKEIRHANLLTPFGAWQIPGFLVLAMELADRTLADRLHEAIRQGWIGIPYEELIEYLSEAAKGIDHLNAHKHTLEGREGVGVQHRDIKPQNILLVGTSVKVADFGLARLLEHTVTGHTGSMTMAYAAPEFFQGKTSSQSDQYSLGVTYCELRGGRLPFAGSAAQVMAGHMMHPPDLNMLPPEERPIVARALAKEPKDRWPKCGTFVEALRSCRPLVAPVAVSPGHPATPASVDHGAATDLYLTGPALDSPAKTESQAPLLPKRSSMPASDPSIRKDTESARSAPTNRDRVAAASPASRVRRPRRARKVLLSLVVGLLLMAGLIHWPPKAPTPDLPPPESSLSLISPTEIRIEAGKKAVFELGAERRGWEGPIRLTFANVPDKVWFEETMIPSGNELAVISVEAARDAIDGDHEVGVIATSGKARQECRLKLIVTRAPTASGSPLRPSVVFSVFAKNGNDHYRQGLYELAIREYKAELREHPNAPAVHCNLGSAYFMKKDYEAAIRHYSRAIERKPTIIQFYEYRARAYAALGDRPHESQDLEKAKELERAKASAPVGPPDGKPKVLQQRTRTWKASSDNFARYKDLAFEIGIGDRQDGWAIAEAGIEIDSVRGVAVTVLEAPKAPQRLNHNSFTGYMLDYHTGAGYSKRLAIGAGVVSGNRSHPAPAWGKSSTPDEVFVLKVPGSPTYILDFNQWAPPGWDGRVWFGVFMQNTGANTTLRVKVDLLSRDFKR